MNLASTVLDALRHADIALAEVQASFDTDWPDVPLCALDVAELRAAVALAFDAFARLALARHAETLPGLHAAAPFERALAELRSARRCLRLLLTHARLTEQQRDGVRGIAFLVGAVIEMMSMAPDDSPDTRFTIVLGTPTAA